MANRIALLLMLISATTAVAFAQETIPPPPLQSPQSQPSTSGPDPFQTWLQSNDSPAVGSSTGSSPSSPPPQVMAAQIGGSQNPTSPPPFMGSGSIGKQPPRPKSPMTYEQNQQAMLETLPDSARQPTQDEEAAFNTMLRQNMPLSPDQIVRLKQQVDLTQRAASIPANIPPKPVSSTIMVNLAPGTTPPAIRLAQGYVSALVFVDSTGTPWPIASFDIGNPKAVNMQWDGKSNVILIQANSPYTTGDIVIRLVGLPTPITLMLLTGQRVVDYRADIHVPGIGPNTKEVPVGTPLPNSANVLLLGVLDGVAPSGSKLLIVRGADAQAYLLGQKLYLRTRMTVLSPGWIGKMSSPDGMMAYELPKTSSVLVSRYGEPAELKIEGF